MFGADHKIQHDKVFKNNLYVLYIIIAAISWGCISLVSRPQGNLGLSAMQVSVVRLFCTTIFMALGFFKLDKNFLKLDTRMLPLFMLAGANYLGLTFFYLSSIRENNSASVAAMLLYTCPIWLIVISRMVFKEKITLGKVIALVGTMGGCAMLLLTQEISISMKGLIFGVASGVCQALYSVFAKLLSKGASVETNTFYTFLFATVFSILFISPIEIKNVITAEPVKCVLLFVVLVIGMTIMPYMLYTIGISKVSIGYAGIICILEPVTSTIVGIVAFGDLINKWGVMGIVIVIMSLVLIEFEDSQRVAA